MSNFELRYFEAAQAKRKMKTVQSDLISASSRLSSQRSKLLTCSGMGVEQMRNQLTVLSSGLRKEANHVQMLNNYMETLEKTVRETEDRAWRHLSGFDIRRKERVIRDRSAGEKANDVKPWYSGLWELIPAIGAGIFKELDSKNFALLNCDNYIKALVSLYKGDYEKVAENMAKPALKAAFKKLLGGETTTMVSEAAKSGDALLSAKVGWATDWVINGYKVMKNKDLTAQEKTSRVIGVGVSSAGVAALGFGAKVVGGAVVGFFGGGAVAVAVGGVAVAWGAKYALDKLSNYRNNNNDGFIMNMGSKIGDGISSAWDNMKKSVKSRIGRGILVSNARTGWAAG